MHVCLSFYVRAWLCVCVCVFVCVRRSITYFGPCNIDNLSWDSWDDKTQSLKILDAKKLERSNYVMRVYRLFVWVRGCVGWGALFLALSLSRVFSSALFLSLSCSLSLLLSLSFHPFLFLFLFLSLFLAFSHDKHSNTHPYTENASTTIMSIQSLKSLSVSLPIPLFLSRSLPLPLPLPLPLLLPLPHILHLSSPFSLSLSFLPAQQCVSNAHVNALAQIT